MRGASKASDEAISKTMKHKSIFITGTDTGVGKTVVTGLLVRFFLEGGINVVTQKMVQTGSKAYSEDIETHLRIMGKIKDDYGDYLKHMAPCIYGLAASPHLAARLENKNIDESCILASLDNLEKNFEIVIVEGAGGLMVPINEERLIIDVVGTIGGPVILVAENRLGAINQTILSIEALKQRRIELLGVVFNQVSEHEEKIVLEDNPDIVGKFTGVDILGILPRKKDLESLYREFRSVGEKVLEKYKYYAEK